MHAPETNPDGADSAILLEGVAKVVRVHGPVAWLEPEQSASCGSCAASSTCGAKGYGTLASRIEARAFTLPNTDDFRAGDRVVVGIAQGSLVRGALLAYGLPLLCAWVGAAVAQSAFGRDIVTMVAMFGGLASGLVLAGKVAGRMFAQGKTRLKYLHRAGPVCVSTVPSGRSAT